jgi:di/tricarboxylate transporter
VKALDRRKCRGVFLAKAFWWIRQFFFILVSIFFVLFGVHVLVSAYGLRDPFSFVLTFFASNLIILISLTMLFVFSMQIWKTVKAGKDTGEILDDLASKKSASKGES